MKSVKVQCPAKINLDLKVINKREDGFHNIESIMQTISLYDYLTISITSSSHTSILLSGTSDEIPYDERNLVYKAAKLFLDSVNVENVAINIYIEKNIPIAAGLAGGSTDAAAVMLAIRDLCKLEVSDEELSQLSKQVGADVPFCVMSQPSVVQGIGEVLEPFEVNCDCEVLLLKPYKGVSTKECFESIQFNNCIHPNVLEVKRCLEEDDFDALSKCVGNTLEEPACKLVPEIKTAKQYLIDLGFEVVCMSGSGSTIFALTRQPELIEKVFNDEEYSDWFRYKCRILKKFK